MRGEVGMKNHVLIGILLILLAVPTAAGPIEGK